MTTPRISMPEIIESQASKYISHNDALRIIDALLQAGVTDRDLTDPPGSPANGAVYIPAATATGAWTGHEGKLAQWYASAWHFLTPAEGWTVWVVDEQIRLVYKSGAWNVEGGTGDFKSDGTVAMTGPFKEAHNAPTISAGAVTFDLALSNNFAVTLTENITSITLANPPASGKWGAISIEFTQDATGGRTVGGWPSSVKWPGGTAPTITSAANAVDVVSGYTRDGGTTYRLGLAFGDSK